METLTEEDSRHTPLSGVVNSVTGATPQVVTPQTDNWANRAIGMVCDTCAYYTNTRCRRNAPVVQHGWPAVFRTDWCGQHKMTKDRINKIESATYPGKEISGT